MKKEITSLFQKRFVECPNWKTNISAGEDYFISGNQEEGERELVRISRKAEGEDFWTYLKEHEVWIHSATEYSTELTKEGHTLHKVQSCSLGPIEKIIELENQVYYHTHPWKVFFETYNVFSKDRPEAKKFFANLFCSWLALPSGFDLKQTFSHSLPTYKIASPFGITSYRLYEGNPPEQLYSVRKPSKIDIEVIFKKGFERYMHYLVSDIKINLPKINFDLDFKRIRLKE
jgi:hypothetical protein